MIGFAQGWNVELEIPEEEAAGAAARRSPAARPPPPHSAAPGIGQGTGDRPRRTHRLPDYLFQPFVIALPDLAHAGERLADEPSIL